MPLPTRKRVVVVTVVAWFLSVFAFEVFRIWTVLSGPPSREEYVNHLDFQLFASAFLLVTRWLPLLGGLLFLELGILALMPGARGKARLPEP